MTITDKILISLGEGVALTRLLKVIKKDLDSASLRERDLITHHDTLLNLMRRWPRDKNQISSLLKDVEKRIKKL